MTDALTGDGWDTVQDFLDMDEPTDGDDLVRRGCGRHGRNDGKLLGKPKMGPVITGNYR